MITFMTIVNEKEYDSDTEIIIFKKDEIIDKTIIGKTLNKLYKSVRKKGYFYSTPKYNVINPKGNVQMNITADTDYVQQHLKKLNTDDWASYNSLPTLAKLKVSRIIHSEDVDRINEIKNELIEELNIKAKEFKRCVIESSIEIDIVIILEFEKKYKYSKGGQRKPK